MNDDSITSALGQTGSDDTVERLRTRLAADAEQARQLDIAWGTVDSPLGALLLAATPVGLVQVAFAADGHDAVLEHLADVISPRILRAPSRVDGAARELDEYFTGHRRTFSVPLDLRLTRGFRRDVLLALRRVAFGQTVSYAALAAATGRARAVRATGTACATNPLPLVIPCHRVVRSDGSPGSYRGGAPAKTLLLALESDAQRDRHGGREP